MTNKQKGPSVTAGISSIQFHRFWLFTSMAINRPTSSSISFRKKIGKIWKFQPFLLLFFRIWIWIITDLHQQQEIYSILSISHFFTSTQRYEHLSRFRLKTTVFFRNDCAIRLPMLSKPSLSIFWFSNPCFRYYLASYCSLEPVWSTCFFSNKNRLIHYLQTTFKSLQLFSLADFSVC